MKMVVVQVKLGRVARGHAFGRVGAGRKTYFADRRQRPRTTRKVRFREEHL